MIEIVLLFEDKEEELIARIKFELCDEQKNLKQKLIKDYIIYAFEIYDNIYKITVFD